ncbi:hypothetical protein FGIG_12097 [Fasciola gigantica]|uniref:Uncharacterized protein n=1 Tax=Fasciola gigantica TaxID=46835 RepID=A0A504YD69_FASGI|nr:hypothetical protein FGIG_12097 [Fasciola gigantica]
MYLVVFFCRLNPNSFLLSISCVTKVFPTELTFPPDFFLEVLSLTDLCKRQLQTMFPPALIRQLDLPQFLLNSLLRPLVAPWHRLASSRS